MCHSSTRGVYINFGTMVSFLLFCVLSILAPSNGYTDTSRRRFPDGFIFGSASAAYQVEGAWDVDGKGESIWDRYLHENPSMIVDGRNGDVASDSYRQYSRDVELLRELGVDFYRFSISWSRVFPKGVTNSLNELGIQYYDNLINELLKYNIEPMVTLYHFDLPQKLQDLGGWANPLSVEWFVDYARVMFDKYANRVKYWITLNQPNTICLEGYGDSVMAPGIGWKGIADYICVRNVMLAHAKVYRMYQDEYKMKYNGSVGISIAVNWLDPINNKTENVEATEEAREFMIGMYMNPIWSKEGDFPRVVKGKVAKKSKEQGFSRSRLPKLTPGEIKLLKGSADFLGMNHYTTYLVSRSEQNHPVPSYDDDLSVDLSQGEKWKPAVSSWLKSAPYGIYKACLHLNTKYDYPKIIITEHGWSTHAGLRDPGRVDNISAYLAALLLAMEDGTDVRGYTAWSLMDNVEWTAGTSERFGLYEVDFESDNKTRTARSSAVLYKHIIESRVVDDGWKPKSLKITISDRRMKRNVKNEKAEL